MTKFLWGKKGQPPVELIAYRLRTMYGCTPSQLAKEPLAPMLQDLTIAGAEQRLQKRQHDFNAKKKKV